MRTAHAARRLMAAVLVFLTVAPRSASGQASHRPVGVAFGGGSARGLAHVGVIRWFEEHHIPIDAAAGTSMGGLIGGAFATGMDADAIEAMLAEIDWDAMFGSSTFEFRNVRRKRDSRAYPSRLEFGLKRGFKLPGGLNNGQQVDLLIARLTAAYFDLASFDDLPTPFRAVAVDLKKARAVVLDRGSLALAMRATMSLPLVFPPIESEGQVLVDGGVMDNVPADVARAMGARRVVAINVGDLADKDAIDDSMLGVASETLDAMMRANSLRALDEADIVINVPLEDYGSLDWRRYRDLIAEGYQAAEAMKDDLLPLAVGEAEWRAWRDARAAKRRTTLPEPATLIVEGVARNDTQVMGRTLAKHVGQPLDVGRLEADLETLGGLDRYQSLDWSLTPAGADGGTALKVRAREKTHGPPFLLVGFSLDNTTSNEFRFGLTSRYIGYDVLGSGSEARIDVGIGSDPHLVASLHRPIGSSPVFVSPAAGAGSQTYSFIEENRIVASYRQTRSWVGLDIGTQFGRDDELRAGGRYGRLDATVRIGDPGLPDLGGDEARVDLLYTHDGQDSPVVPSRGLHLRAGLRHFLDAPNPPEDFETTRSTRDVTQGELRFSQFWSIGHRGRVLVTGGAGTSFDGSPLVTEQFPLGGPFRLGAFSIGEQRGDHYAVLSGGYLHQVLRLPDLLGGPLLVGGWLDTGSAFNEAADADVAVHASVGAIADTLLGPAFVAVSAGFDGAWRAYIGIGRVFR